MERVYFPDPILGERVTVTGPEAHHLARVRRAAPGDPVELFDGRGVAYRGRVESVERDRVGVRIEEAVPGRPEPAVDLTLATAVPKGERFDWLIEKATELGVARIIPLKTERSVVDPRSSKLDRLRRHVVEASKQCGRDRLLDVCEPREWAVLLAGGPDGVGLIAHPGGSPVGRLGPLRRATVAIGPEGGFTDREVQQALDLGWRPIGLGPNLFRVETAGLASCAAILALGEAEIA